MSGHVSAEELQLLISFSLVKERVKYEFEGETR